MKKTAGKSCSSNDDLVTVHVGVGYGWMKVEEGASGKAAESFCDERISTRQQ